MMLPPLVARVRVVTPRHAFGAWLPLFLLWILLLPLALLLLVALAVGFAAAIEHARARAAIVEIARASATSAAFVARWS